MGYQDNYEIQIKNSEERSLLCSRQMMSVADFGKYFGKVYERIAREHLTVSGREISIYHDQEFNPEGSDIEVAVPIKETEKADRVLPPMLCAVTVHKGSYSSLSDAYGALMRWVEQNGYEMVDSPFEVYLKSQFDRAAGGRVGDGNLFPCKNESVTLTVRMSEGAGPLHNVHSPAPPL